MSAFMTLMSCRFAVLQINKFSGDKLVSRERIAITSPRLHALAMKAVVACPKGDGFHYEFDVAPQPSKESAERNARGVVVFRRG